MCGPHRGTLSQLLANKFVSNSRCAPTSPARNRPGLLPCHRQRAENRAALARAFIFNLFGIAGTLRGCCRKRGRTTGPGRARTAGPCHAYLSRGVVPRPAHAVAPALRRDRFKRGCNWLWRTFVRWCGNGRTRHGVCVLGLGCGYNSPSPPARQLQASRLAGLQTLRPVFGIAVFGSPTYLSCYRFYGHFVGVIPNAQKHVVNRWSLCRIAPRFRLVKCGGRCPQSLRVPRVLACSSRQLYRQPAPKRPLPRFGYKENTKKKPHCVLFTAVFGVVFCGLIVYICVQKNTAV